MFLLAYCSFVIVAIVIIVIIIDLGPLDMMEISPKNSKYFSQFITCLLTCLRMVFVMHIVFMIM